MEISGMNLKRVYAALHELRNNEQAQITYGDNLKQWQKEHHEKEVLKIQALITRIHYEITAEDD